MVTMPGTPTDSWSPEGEAQTRAITAREPVPYKPDMGLQVKPDQNPYEAFRADTDFAERSAPADVDWKERFVQHFRNAQQYGTPGLNDLGEIQDADMGYVGGVGVGPEAGKQTADFLRDMRRERQAQFEGMKPAETAGDYAAAVGGAVAGAVTDPLSLVGPVVKIGTTGWRMAYPMLSRLLDHGVSNAAMNVALNGAVQAEEFGADMRDEVDWLSLGVDALAGGAFGIPFGYLDGRAAADFYTREAARAASAPPAPGPMAPRQPQAETPPPQTMAPPTAAELQAEYSAQDLAQAQEDLFGEVVGTRNLTPEQAAQLDDYLNAGRAGDIPQAEPETPGGLTNEDVPLDLPGNPIGDFIVQQEAADLSVDPAKYRGEKTPALMAGGKIFTGERHADALEKAIKTFGADSPEIQAIDADPTKHLGILNPGGLFSSGEFRPGISGDDGRGVKEAIASQRAAEVDQEWADLTGGTAPDAPPTAELVTEATPAAELAPPKPLGPDAKQIGVNADGNQVWDRGRDDGRRAVVLPDGKVQLETPTMLQGPGFEANPARESMFEVTTPAPRQAPPAPLPIDRTERQFSPSDLKVDAKRFQFKDGGDEAGVTDRLKGVKTWDPIKSGVTLVWEDLEGNFFIADGHQRHGLASRLEKEGQDPKIRAVVLREADGVTAEDARAIAAAKNIAEGTGNAIDAAKILRSRPDMGVDLPPTSALVRDAQGLASLSDDAFGMVINKKVPAGYAAQVGRLAPDPKTHAELLGLLAKEQPDNAIEAESMIRDALEAPAVQSTMEDMFGSAEVTQILFKERAQVLSAAATAIRKDRAAFATLVREEARLTGAGNKLATQTNAKRATQDAEILATLQAQARRKGPVADALAAAAKRLKDGGSRQVVVRDFLDQLRRSGPATGADGGIPGAAGRESETGIAARLEPGAPAFRVNDDVSGTYYVARIQRQGSRSVRGKNAGNLGGVARHAGQLDDFDSPAFAGGSGNSIAVYKITAPPQKAGKYERSNKVGGQATSSEIGVDLTPWPDGKARIAYSFGEDANFTEELITEVPLEKAKEALSRIYPQSRGSFDEAGDLLSAQAIGEAIDEALQGQPNIAFSRRPVQAGPGLFETGADNKPQAVIPGAERIGDKRLAEMRAAAPLRPKRPQKAMDLGLFSDDADQQGFAFSAPNHPPATAKEIGKAFMDSQPERSLDELYEGGILQRRQDELVAAGQEIAQDLGITFKNPGIKKRATTEEKIGRKGYRSTKQLGDLVRSGFEVQTPQQADALVQRLAEFFDVLDEGWIVTPHGYFDRKVAVRFYDGTIGEVQVWEPQLAYAKMKGGGTELYTASRSMPEGPERAQLEQAMIDLYAPIVDSLPPSWSAVVLGNGGSAPKVLEKVSASDSALGRTFPDSPTSMESTGVQSSPGANMAQALPTDQSAGRLSQSTNFTDPSFNNRPGADQAAAQDGTLSQGTASDPLMQPGPWRDATVMAVDETGKAIPVNAGDAVDFMLTRIQSLRQLLECINAG
jgi:hypothetical protein